MKMKVFSIHEIFIFGRKNWHLGNPQPQPDFLNEICLEIISHILPGRRSRRNVVNPINTSIVMSKSKILLYYIWTYFSKRHTSKLAIIIDVFVVVKLLKVVCFYQEWHLCRGELCRAILFKTLTINFIHLEEQ